MRSLLVPTTLLLVVGLSGCRSERSPSIVSEAPDDGSAETVARTVPRPGQLGVRARVTFADLEAIAAATLPERRLEQGERRLCKRVIGLKVCGTARWDVALERTGALDIASADDDTLALRLPLRMAGTVGFEGRFAAALGLSSLDLRGAAVATARLSIDLGADWCPRLDVELDHAWTDRPALDWAAGIGFDLEERLDRLIAAELESLPARLEDAIDCERFRAQLERYWRPYRVPLSLPGEARARLDIEPTGFGFSGIRAESAALGMGFVLSATSVVHDAPLPSEEWPRPLPPLERVPYTTGRTSFELLVRAGYEALETLAAPALLERTFRSKTAAGDVAVDIESVTFAGRDGGVSVTLAFAAELPATRDTTRGVLYLTARPVVDPVAEKVSLVDVRLSRVLDSRLWNLVSVVFEEQIVGVIEQRAVLDLAPRARDLERRIAQQLADPERTNGLAIDARNIDVRLLSLTAEREGLAAVARVDAELDIDVPLAVLQQRITPRSPD